LLHETQEEIKEKGFYMDNLIDYASKVKINGKTLIDAVIEDNAYYRINPRYGSKEKVLQAVHRSDYAAMRDISNFFYKTSGIYSRLCRYLAYLYRYDWLITPYCNSDSIDEKKLKKTFFNALKFLDDFEVKRVFGEIALKVIRYGCYYGYVITKGDTVALQELPPKYCRTRFSVGNYPAIEFNMSYFDNYYTDVEQRMAVLRLFPKDFQKGYRLYKQKKLKPAFRGDTEGWYLLELGSAIKFNINGEDMPFLMSVIPAIIDLNQAQDLDKKKLAQGLMKIIVQKLPIDKNGDIVFDVDEGQQLHNNVVRMLADVIGVQVLTTFADVKVEDMADTTTSTTTDNLERYERSVYDEAGVAQLQFNASSNMALKYSILNDEATMYNLISQFESFLNFLLTPFNTNKKFNFRAQILTTTIYNYQELSKLFKEQTQLGYSKILPQLALGQSQSAILANATFENEVLDLVNTFIPPMSSNTMSADALAIVGNKSTSTSTDKGGRPELPDEEKSDKTIQNLESQ
jgi:hypothetical protein